MKLLKFTVAFALTVFCINELNAQQLKAKEKTEKTQKIEKAYACPMKCEGDKTYEKEGKCPVCKMNLKEVKKEVKTVAYQCPMKCERDKTYEKEGKCPVCKMNLKEIENKKSSKEGHEGHNHQ